MPREVASGETRVAVTPETAGKLARLGFEVAVEALAGARAHFDDAAYAQAGVAVVASARELYGTADVVLKVLEPMAIATGGNESELLRSGAVLIGFMSPARNADLIARLARGGVTALAMELIPRITRAQKMDALSSMSTVAGYKAALLAADTLGKFFPLLMTAAGTIAPAKVLVLGAGVAGLQAIATARRLGAVIEAFDVRPAVRDEVKSLGATFVGDELVSESAAESSGYARAVGAEHEAKIRELLHKHVAQSDVVIATANVPGRRAPVLVTEAMVRDMRPGSGDRRPRRRERRQLRADPGRQDHHRERRGAARPGAPGRGAARPCQSDVCAQRARAGDASRQGREGRRRPRRRDHPRLLRGATRAASCSARRRGRPARARSRCRPKPCGEIR